MSAFVGWHTFAILLAPAPGASGLVQSLRVLFQPYLTLFRLDDSWSFFAPNVGKGSQLRYIIRDASGEDHVFVPVAKSDWLHSNSIWFADSYEALLNKPDIYGDAVARLFCKKHTSLKPVSITFQEVVEHDFWPEDRLKGKHPLDPEYVKVNTVKTIKCPEA